MTVLSYPKKQTIAFSNTLFNLYEIAKTPGDKEVHFDLSKSELLTPLGIILLTTTIAECQKDDKKCFYKAPKDKKLRRFLTEVGFHKYFQLEKYGEPKDYDISSGHVQLQKRKNISPGLIETITDILDFHLSISKDLKGSLQMSLLEMMTNVVDHSGVQEYYVCCWNYPDKGQIRLCMADMGIGIPKSLRKIKQYSTIKNDHELIKLSTEEGVSSRPERGGLGLNHIKKFLNVNEGQLCIISGKGKVFWKFDQGKEQKQTMSSAYKGTIVKMIINTRKEAYYFLSSEKDYLF